MIRVEKDKAKVDLGKIPDPLCFYPVFLKVDCSTSKEEESNAKIGNEDLYTIHLTSPVRRASPANYKTTEQEVELMGGGKTAKVF